MGTLINDWKWQSKRKKSQPTPEAKPQQTDDKTGLLELAKYVSLDRHEDSAEQRSQSVNRG